MSKNRSRVRSPQKRESVHPFNFLLINLLDDSKLNSYFVCIRSTYIGGSSPSPPTIKINSNWGMAELVDAR